MTADAARIATPSPAVRARSQRDMLEVLCDEDTTVVLRAGPERMPTKDLAEVVLNAHATGRSHRACDVDLGVLLDVVAERTEG